MLTSDAFWVWADVIGAKRMVCGYVTTTAVVVVVVVVGGAILEREGSRVLPYVAVLVSVVGVPIDRRRDVAHRARFRVGSAASQLAN